MKWGIVVFGVFVLLLFGTFLAGLGSAQVNGQIIKENNANFSARGTTPHGVIRINNNADFVANNGVVGGNGTEGNPYLISGWYIDDNSSENSIYIGNTTAYFIIENCLLYNTTATGSPYFDGSVINIYNVTHGTIRNNTLSDGSNNGIRVQYSSNIAVEHNMVRDTSEAGIALDYSYNNTVYNNTILNTGNYIMLTHSNNNTILNNYGSQTISGGAGLTRGSDNNTMSNNTFYNEGIYISQSNNNTVQNNTISTDGDIGVNMYAAHNNLILQNRVLAGARGIQLSHSNNNTLKGNSLSIMADGINLEYSLNDTLIGNIMLNGSVVIYGEKNIAYWNSHTIDGTNTINGKPIAYWKNKRDSIVPNGQGEVIIANCTNVTVANEEMDGGTFGILVGFSTHINITKNIIRNQFTDGIYLWYANNTIISKNTAKNATTGSGIYSLYSDNCTISGNNLTENKYDGIIVEYSNNTTISNNYASGNDQTGMYLYFFDNGTIDHNTLLYNDHYGIYIFGSHNTITNNTLNHNKWYGIYISGDYNIAYLNYLYFNMGSESSFVKSHEQGYSYGNANYWNTTTGIGNYWYDWANNNDTNDNNNDGIVDWPYPTANPAIVDYYPIKNDSLSNILTHPLTPSAKSGAGFVNITWQAPAYGKNSVIGYKIYRNGINIENVSSEQLWYNDTTVRGGTTYMYYITAISTNGESAPSNKVQATPGQAVPELQAFWLPIIALLLLLGVLRRQERKDN